MTSVLGYSRQDIEQAPSVKPEDTVGPKGFTNQEMNQLIEIEDDLEWERNRAAENFATISGFGFIPHAFKTIGQESVITNLAGVVSSWATPYDLNYTEDKLEADITNIGETLPEWALEDLRDAKSPEHFQNLLAKVHKQNAYNQEADYLGGAAMAASMAGMVLSPETMLFGVGEAALLSKFALTGAKKFATFGGVAALSNMGQELVVMANNNSRTNAGLIMAGAFGFGFGGGVGMLTKSKSLAAETKLYKAVAEDTAESMRIDAEVAVAPAANLSKAPELPEIQVRPEEPVAGSVGAAAAIPAPIKTGIEALREKMPFLKKNVKKLKSVRPAALRSLAANGLASDNAIERQVYDAWVENAAGRGGREVATHSAFLRGERNTMQLRSVFNNQRDRGYAAWKRDLTKEGGWDRSSMSQATFDDEVFKEISRRFNGQDLDPNLNPAIKAVADARLEAERLRFKMLQDNGVKGYREATFNKNQISHQWDSAKMHGIARDLRDNGVDGRKFIVDMLRKSILGGKEFRRSKKYADVIAAGKFDETFRNNTALYQAEAIYERFITRPIRGGATEATLLTKQDRTKLTEAVKRLTDRPEDYKHIMKSLSPGDQRAVNETLSQIHLDANLEIDGYAVRDLLDTSMGRNLDSKFRRDGGRAGLAEFGVDSEDTFLQIKEAVVAEELNLRGGGSIKEVQKFGDKKSAELIALYRLILGENIEADPGAASKRFARGLRNMATLSAMNQVGFAQAAEIGRLASTIGIKSMLTNIVEFGSMRRNMISGKLKSPMLRDFEAASSVRLGDNHLLEHAKLRADAGGHTLSHEDSPAMLKMLDSAIQKGLHVQGYINGMNMIMRYQHRAHAKGMMMRTFDELSVKGLDNLKPARVRRYADIGLSTADLKTMKKQMDKYSTDTTGWFGQQRLENLNLSKWDSEIREKVVLAMHKAQAQAIQRNLAGETPLWAETSFGKLLTQFKTFPMVALEKQLIHDAKHFDAEAFMTATYSLSMASAMYMASTYANSFGLDRRKRRKFLKNRLSPSAIAQGAVNWSGQASIIPDAMNAAGSLMGLAPFQYTSTKGSGFRRAGDLKLGALGAGPNYLNSAYRFATGLGHSVLSGDELTASTFRHGTRLIPFNNALGIRNIGNALSNNFK